MNAKIDAPGLVLGERVQVGEAVSFGAYVVVHGDTTIGNGCTIEDHAILGKTPKRRPGVPGGELTPLRIEDSVTACARLILFAGTTVGARTILGDGSYIRERSTIGSDGVIGGGTVIENDVLVGDRVRVQSSAYLTAFTVIEDDVFVGPGVVTTNDNTMSRHSPDMPLRGATLRRACRIGGGTVITPGVEIGEEAFVAAGSVVTRDVPPRAVVMGAPARVVREVPDEDLLEKWR